MAITAARLPGAVPRCRQRRRCHQGPSWSERHHAADRCAAECSPRRRSPRPVLGPFHDRRPPSGAVSSAPAKHPRHSFRSFAGQRYRPTAVPSPAIRDSGRLAADVLASRTAGTSVRCLGTGAASSRPSHIVHSPDKGFARLGHSGADGADWTIADLSGGCVIQAHYLDWARI
jgi:hypothetical protein